MLSVSQLLIYPIKSLGGIALSTAQLTDRGLEYDRRWMLIDENNRFLSQREHAQLALFKIEILSDGLKVIYTADSTFVNIPFIPLKQDLLDVTIWDDTCAGQLVSDAVDAWFTVKLSSPTRLVYMPDETHRATDPRYTTSGSIASFADAYPALLIGQASLDDLNNRLAQPLPINRFRPNIVFEGGEPYSEDQMNHIRINGIDMYGVKLCARCVMTTIDQETTAKSKEPLKTLAGYRRKGAKILFGQNLAFNSSGTISVGDELNLLSTHTEERFFINVPATSAV
ncbi:MULTISPECIES: MOSC N-terminal beta barrel domain-containing protein [unclassified Mucilaginibacter]|uniref:MOSC domain-containing protein n=1 Tax=unclassified Mucilaginibacter TaxID=2617802 RepID=UPI002AC9131C|nr:MULTISPECIES: MOSC N-terminal beta barrel domain-containing protein [unclassified Mucilaginibacter]MEB0261233.1 MOSC domain-containing protein [Mucilaginibacter sp. 10I4]MEB0279057.1 MOSC domain-containing protein [Mucilaginibacter sp. 10B2]MEB0299924.1 MOSC domain-containing protein [Mucilaginibacter sp. 5C4]WPX22235.1 MOSC domain-containing protein [Mucilaginibacter sp. 5C4]